MDKVNVYSTESSAALAPGARPYLMERSIEIYSLSIPMDGTRLAELAEFGTRTIEGGDPKPKY